MNRCALSPFAYIIVTDRDALPWHLSAYWSPWLLELGRQIHQTTHADKWDPLWRYGEPYTQLHNLGYSLTTEDYPWIVLLANISSGVPMVAPMSKYSECAFAIRFVIFEGCCVLFCWSVLRYHTPNTIANTNFTQHSLIHETPNPKLSLLGHHNQSLVQSTYADRVN